jgi:hypothetical protein
MKGLKTWPNTYFERRRPVLDLNAAIRERHSTRMFLLQQPAPRALVDEVLPSPSWRHRRKRDEKGKRGSLKRKTRGLKRVGEGQESGKTASSCPLRATPKE